VRLFEEAGPKHQVEDGVCVITMLKAKDCDEEYLLAALLLAHCIHEFELFFSLLHTTSKMAHGWFVDALVMKVAVISLPSELTVSFVFVFIDDN